MSSRFLMCIPPARVTPSTTTTIKLTNQLPPARMAKARSSRAHSPPPFIYSRLALALGNRCAHASPPPRNFCHRKLTERLFSSVAEQTVADHHLQREGHHLQNCHRPIVSRFFFLIFFFQFDTLFKTFQTPFYCVIAKTLTIRFVEIFMKRICCRYWVKKLNLIQNILSPPVKSFN